MTALITQLTWADTDFVVPGFVAFGYTERCNASRPALPVCSHVPHAHADVIRHPNWTLGMLGVQLKPWPDPEDWTVLLGRIADFILLDYDVMWLAPRDNSLHLPNAVRSAAFRTNVVFWATQEYRTPIPQLYSPVTPVPSWALPAEMPKLLRMHATV